MDGVSAQTTSVPASLKVSYKCDALAYHPQSRLLAISSSNLTGATWSGLITLAALSDTYAPTKPPTTLDTDAGNADVTFAGEKGEFVAAGSDEGSVLLWHTDKPAKEGTDIALGEHDDIVSAVAAHQSHLLSASWDHKIKLWDVTKGNSLATFEAHIGAVNTVEFINAALFVSGAQDKTVRVWDKRQAVVASTLQRAYNICSVSASRHDDNLFAVGQEDGSACVFDRRNLAAALFCHTTGDSVRAVRFSPHTAGHLAVASDDTTLSVLDTTTQKTIYSFAGHTDYVRGVAWDPLQPHALASGGWDGLVYFHAFSA
ncbi:WD40 repeat-containing protein [Acanthamoeba castellanii str. Neff]|uniref:WD40 repeat-containing protein n=1 Tax=Acanthamoeba castellanii (strain ATCC 30010 / Neff) TaxID=1257118 RepID=L8HIV6_ACACF|nr:WD40 repeat-containing protein [Acanthamoeba castellanii str. Neff]ELR24341.1 WD40 repeat-containing protein [Acanthamoeba castellanii str. Neff]